MKSVFSIEKKEICDFGVGPGKCKYKGGIEGLRQHKLQAHGINQQEEIVSLDEVDDNKILFCDPDSPSPGSKIDSIGNYRIWEGSTIVMALDDSCVIPARTLFDALCADRLITSHLGVLPLKSYHVTLRGMKNRKDFRSGNEYNIYLRESRNAMIMLDTRFREESCLSDGIRLEIDLAASLSSPLPSLRFFESGPHEEKLRQWEQEAVSAFSMKKSRRQSWHLSLGYYYKTPATEAEAVSLRGAVERCIRAFAAECPIVVLDRPRVCTFRDMTHFEPVVACVRLRGEERTEGTKVGGSK